MKKSTLFLFSLLISVSVFGQTFRGKILSVKDGDSFIVLINDKPTEIRLQGVDCPEYSQPFGREATDFTTRLCLDREVTLNVTGKDKYDRTLAFVKLPDGSGLSESLLKAGFAWHYKKYNSDETLARIESEAKQMKVGLWSDPSPVAPWDYRHGSNATASVSAPGVLFNNPSTTGVVSYDHSDATSQTDYVYICVSKNAVAYHAYQCKGLARCVHIIEKVTVDEARKRGYRPCKICYN